MRPIPIFASIVVALATATMIGLGFWQLQRQVQKEALIAQYSKAADLPETAYPLVPAKDKAPLFRKSRIMCVRVESWQAVAGTSYAGKAGFAHIARCDTGGAEGPDALVAVGWSNRPTNPDWKGGMITGVIAPDNKAIVRLVADQPVQRLERLAAPSIAAISNNHFLYAIQWFFFATAAAVIYGFALRRRWLDRSAAPPA